MRRRDLFALPSAALMFQVVCRKATAAPPGQFTVRQWQNWLADAAVPGVAVVRVGEKGEPSVLCAGVTRNSPSESNPITPDTVFDAASLSKQVVAYAVLALVRQGLWNLDRPLGDYVQLEGSPQAGRVTARHLLSHASGFPNWRFDAGQPLVPDAEPGTRFRYSGEGYVYLQRVIEQLTGKPFALYLQEAVFAPHGLHSATFAWPAQDGSRAMPHNKLGQPIDRTRQRNAYEAYVQKSGKQPESWRVSDQEEFLRSVEMPPLPTHFPINAAASLKISAVDYAKFLTVAMQDPMFGEWQINFAKKYAKLLGWGLGWGIERTEGQQVWWQWGDNNGYKHIVFAQPAAGKAIAVFTNGDNGAAVYRKVIGAANKMHHPALAWL